MQRTNKHWTRACFAALGLTLLSFPVCTTTAFADDKLWQAAFDVGMRDKDNADYAAAEDRLRLAVTEAEKFGPRNARMPQSLNALGGTLALRGKLDEAQTIHERALRLAEANFGPMHPEVASSLSGLGVIYDALGTPDKAEPLFKRALAIREASLGSEHADVGRSLYDLACCAMAQANYGQARTSFQHALTVFEKAKGVESPEVGRSLVALGICHENQNMITEAAESLKHGVAILERALSPQHPDLALGRVHLAGLFVEQDRIGEGISLYERAIPVLERTRSAGDVQVAANKADLAAAYVSQQRYADAERLYGESLPVLEKAMGKDDPLVKSATASYEEVRKFNASAQAQSDGAAPEHETRYVNGTSFKVATQGDLQVWMAVWKGRELQTMLYVVNGSERPITFYPGQILVEALKQGKDGVKRVPIKTFTAEQYERKVSNASALKAFAYAMGSNGNKPQPQTSYTSGQYEVRSSNGTARGSYYGTITRWPSQADYAAAKARDEARLDAMTSQLEASYQATSSSLMRTQTLDPHTYYGGTVYMNTSGKDYVMTVPLGDASVQFAFTFDR